MSRSLSPPRPGPPARREPLGPAASRGSRCARFLGSSISFPLELSSAPKWVEIPFGVTNPDPAHCPGTAESPSAAPGYLCIYDRIVGNDFSSDGNRLQVSDINGDGGTVSPFGARITARATSNGEVEVEGSWAVTAP